MNKIFAIVYCIIGSNAFSQNQANNNKCDKIAVVFETRFKNTSVKVFADDSLYFNKKITNKNIKVLEVADAVFIEKIHKIVTIQIGGKQKKTNIIDSTCYIYVKRKGLFGKISIEQSVTQRHYR